MVSRMMRRVFVIFAIIVPVSLLVCGWGFAAFREHRLQDRMFAEMEARGDASVFAQRESAHEHRRVEAASLAGLAALLAFAAWAMCKAVLRERELHEKKTAFVAAVTHELRTPLTTLRMHAEMLEGDLVPEDRKARVYAELVRESNRLSRLVENVLAMSKLEEGRWVLEKKTGDLASAVETIVGTLVPRARDLGFDLKFSAAKACPAIAFDARAVELVTQNLVDNALKYAGSEKRDNVIDVEVRPDANALQLIVSDRGPGIEPSRREQVFERFERAHDQDKPGSGLGLALVRELARAHGGDARLIGCEEGTRIAVTFPV